MIHRLDTPDNKSFMTELVEAILETAPNSLESFFLQDWNRAENDQQRLRVVIDQVASLTDPGALSLHERLVNRK